MTITYGIEPYGPDILAAYRRLFPDDADKDRGMLDWRFAANPHGEGRFAVAREGDRIVGMIALLPTSLTCGGRTLRAFQAIDTIVDPAARGKFLFVRMGKLAEDFCAGQGALLWGFPNAQAARGWFGRLGWTRTGSVPFLIRPLRSGYVFRKLSPSLASIDLALFRPSDSPYGDLATLDDGRYDRLWTEQSGRIGLGVDRTAAWMRWRLAKPGADYRYGTVGERELDAFAAITSADKHGGRITYVMEALARPGEERSLTRLLRSMIAEDGADGSEVVLAWCNPGSPNYRAYRRAGFLPFPDRLRPIEIHHGYWSGPGDEAMDAMQASPWYLSYLDSDTV